MPRRKKMPANLDELIRSQPCPDSVTDDQIRRMLLQVLLDSGSDPKKDPDFKRMKNKIEGLRLLHQMNHVKNEDDATGEALLEALRGRSRQG